MNYALLVYMDIKIKFVEDHWCLLINGSAESIEYDSHVNLLFVKFA